jgi:hypothetical protein
MMTRSDDSFNAWMAEVDKLLGSKVGVTSQDLPDACWRDAFDDGMTAEQAIEIANEDAWDSELSDLLELVDQ